MSLIRVIHPITRLIVGGAQENTMFTAALLDKSRFHTEILSGAQTGSEGNLIEEVRSRGVPLTILPELVRQIDPLNDLRALRKLTHHMRLGGYSIVHTHSSKAGILGRLAARQARVPVIVHTVHGWSFHEHMSPIRKMAYIMLERYAASFTNVLIVVTKRDIEKGLRAKVGHSGQYQLIRSAIPLEEFNPTGIDGSVIRRALNIPNDVVVVGNVGRFSIQKNPLDWVRVAGRVARAHPQVYFLLTGDGPLRPSVELALAQEGITQRTVLTGLRRDVPHILAAMDIFMLTSLWEGLPRVLPQAMAMGLPVIANRVDGTVEAIRHGETGFLCTPGNLDQMIERGAYLIENSQERSLMGQRGRAYALQEFDLKDMIHQIEALYEDQLNQAELPPT